MMNCSLISIINDDVLPSAHQYFYLDESKSREDKQVVQFDVLLEYLESYPPESLGLLFLSIKAITPRFGKEYTYQLIISSESSHLYLCEVNERMKDFLCEYFFDPGGYVRIAFQTSTYPLSSLWREFPKENSSTVLADEKMLYSLRGMPVLGKDIPAGKNMTSGEVLGFKKIQSAFKKELHGIQESLNVLNSPEAIESFRYKKTVELMIQTGVHTGLSITGSALGAVIGTAIAPGIGSLIGAGVGAGVSWLSKIAYNYAASRVSNRINPNPHLKTQDIARNLKSAEKGRIWWCGEKIKSICVKPSRTATTLGAGIISFLTKEVSLPLHDIATACYDYGKSKFEGLTAEKATKIETLLEKYYLELKEKYQLVLDYLDANPTPDNQRRKKKILERDEVIRNRLEIIRKSIKDAMELTRKTRGKRKG
ncbi:hypothetical protein ACLETS_23975 [Enterobacter ludwigii]|uniref:hypothetical protein n=1 Tax=Enterobacter ludwigii TaxID=299767 RepID=UPI003975685B